MRKGGRERLAFKERFKRKEILGGKERGRKRNRERETWISAALSVCKWQAAVSSLHPPYLNNSLLQSSRTHASRSL